MLNTIFTGVFDTTTTNAVQMGDFLLCVAVSLVIGVYLAAVYTYKSRYTQSFVMTLALLPAVVCVVIMMVNGNVGAGVAVAGAFSLVRFRSLPAGAKDILLILTAMFAGLAAAIGYLLFGALLVLVAGGLLLAFYKIPALNKSGTELQLRIKTPEDLDYTVAFSDVFAAYTRSCRLTRTKTTNLGSLNELTYLLELKHETDRKKLIDELRALNGNLPVSLEERNDAPDEL